jgi:hypothetical protein
LTEGVHQNQEKNLRENYGVYPAPNYCAFKKDEIEKLFNQNRYVDGYENVDYFLCCIDPNGGGSNDTAIMFGANVGGKYAIISINFKNTNVDFADFILNELYHFHKTIRKTTSIPIIVALESISNHNGNYINENIKYNAKNIDAYKNIHLIREKEDERGDNAMYGVYLDKYRKRDMLIMLQVLVEEGILLFHKDFYTKHPNKEDFVKGEAKLQFLKWKLPETMSSIKRNGKKTKGNNAKGYLSNDDVVLVLLMFGYWDKMLKRNPDFMDQLQRVLPRKTTQPIYTFQI